MTEVAAASIDFLVPIMGQLNERRLEFRGAIHVSRRGEKHERVTASIVVDSPRLDETELIDVEIERLLKIRDADHRMQIFHDLPPLHPMPVVEAGRRATKLLPFVCHG